ncbi:MAG TPA: hypothetical protein DCM07_24120, partial [Planctomycetaceae bacterium]|nr:hypothetical protein [Planctomycetaceae bacterium]
KNDTPLVLWFVVVPWIHIFLVGGTNFDSLFYIVATDSLSIGFCLFICFALTFGKSVLVFCDNNSPEKDLGGVQFHYSDSRALWNTNQR